MERAVRCGAEVGLKIWYFREEKVPEFWWGVIRYKTYQPVSREPDRRMTRNLVTCRKHPILNACKIPLPCTQNRRNGCVPEVQQMQAAEPQFHTDESSQKNVLSHFFHQICHITRKVVRILGSIGGDEATLCPQFYMSKSHDPGTDSPALEIAPLLPPCPHRFRQSGRSRVASKC